MKGLKLLCLVLVVSLAACGPRKPKVEPKPMTPEEIAANQVTATTVRIQKITQAVELFRLDYNRIPKTLEDLSRRPDDIGRATWRGPYYTGSLQDAWGNDIIYREPEDGDDLYEVVSLGEDGKAGGEGHAADLTNHDN